MELSYPGTFAPESENDVELSPQKVKNDMEQQNDTKTMHVCPLCVKPRRRIFRQKTYDIG